MQKAIGKKIEMKDFSIVLTRIKPTIMNNNNIQLRRSERIRNIQIKKSNVMPAKRTQRIRSIASSNPSAALTSILVKPGSRSTRSKSVAFDSSSSLEAPNVENHSNNSKILHSSNISVSLNKPNIENQSDIESKANSLHSSAVTVSSNKANNENRSGESNESQNSFSSSSEVSRFLKKRSVANRSDKSNELPNSHSTKAPRLLKKPSIASRSGKLNNSKKSHSSQFSRFMNKSDESNAKSRSGKWLISKSTHHMEGHGKQTENNVHGDYEETFDSVQRKALFDSIKVQDATMAAIRCERDSLQKHLNDSYNINSLLTQELDTVLKELHEMELQNRKLEMENDSLQDLAQQLNAVNSENDNVLNELREVKLQNQKLEMEKGVLQGKVNKLSRTLLTSDAELVDWVLAQESRVPGDKENVAPLVLKEIHETKLQNEKLVSEKVVLQSRLEKLNHTLFEFREENDALHSIVNTYSVQVAEEHNYQMTRVL